MADLLSLFLSAGTLPEPETLTLEETAQILTGAPGLLDWVERVRSWALEAAVEHNASIPGFKLVESRCGRRYKDEAAIAAALHAQGFGDGQIYKPRELLGVTAMERLVGKARLENLAGAYIEKPRGTPCLAPLSDRRKVWSKCGV